MEYGITRNVWDDDVLDDNFMMCYKTDRYGLRDIFWVNWEPVRTKILNSGPPDRDSNSESGPDIDCNSESGQDRI